MQINLRMCQCLIVETGLVGPCTFYKLAACSICNRELQQSKSHFPSQCLLSYLWEGKGREIAGQTWGTMGAGGRNRSTSFTTCRV